MSNPTIELIHKHGSVRRYKQDPVPREMVEAIVAAGQRASTSSNMQMYSVVATLDDDKRAQLQTLCGDQKHISQAPVFLTWCADLSRLDRMCKRQGYEQEAGYVENFLLTAVDVAIMSQNAGLAAESLGLGFCYIGAIRNRPQAVIELLNLPKLTFPIAGMTLGWPVKPPRLRPRLALDAVLHWETYDTANEEEHLQAYDEAMIATGIYRGRQVKTTNAGVVEEKVYGWVEHTARRAAQVVRPHLREALRDQGFELK
ncbi:MAG: NADPH-dependent oxidoreductase [Chloroflexi bacterium]|nr:NADPH-dependent oxidoreductase [Chloroflexota bacterium]